MEDHAVTPIPGGISVMAQYTGAASAAHPNDSQISGVRIARLAALYLKDVCARLPQVMASQAWCRCCYRRIG